MSADENERATHLDDGLLDLSRGNGLTQHLHLEVLQAVDLTAPPTHFNKGMVSNGRESRLSVMYSVGMGTGDLRDDGVRLVVEHLGDGTTAVLVGRGGESHEARQQLRLLAQDDPLHTPPAYQHISNMG